MFTTRPSIMEIIAQIRMKMRYQKLEDIAQQLWAYGEDREYVDSFSEIYELWHKYYKISMKSMGVKSSKTIKALFDEWDMENWEAMHYDNTEYKNNSRDELYHIFSTEAEDIADRMSFDRLFRTHWMFRQIFDDELNCMRHEWYAEYLEKNILLPVWQKDGLRVTKDEMVKKLSEERDREDTK